MPNTPSLTTQFTNNQATQTKSLHYKSTSSQTTGITTQDQSSQIEATDTVSKDASNQPNGWVGLGYLFGSLFLIFLAWGWLKSKKS